MDAHKEAFLKLFFLFYSINLSFGAVIAARSGPRPTEKQSSALRDTSGAHSGVSLKPAKMATTGRNTLLSVSTNVNNSISESQNPEEDDGQNLW